MPIAIATIIVTLQLFDIAVTQLVVGGAVTGVIVGIAAQQSLANVFSGIILLSARPFRVGDRIGIRSGALSGLLEGTVTEISLTYVLLETASGPLHVPNSQVLAAAVGPAGAVPAPSAPPPVGAPPDGQEAAQTGQEPATGQEAAQKGQEPPGGQEAAPGGQEAEATGPLAGASAAEANSSAPAPPHAADPQVAQRDAGRQPS